MKKAFVLFLSAILLVSLFISCGPEPIWEIIVRYDGNGSTSGTMEKQTVVKGEELTLNENTFERTNYYFLGWNTKDDGSGTMYPDGDTVRLTEDTTLYAQWGFNGVAEIKFDANGGQGQEKMYPQWVIIGVESTLKQNKFSRDEYYFIGWNTKDDGTGTWYSDSDTATFEGDTTLYAQWYKEVVKITFISNGGGGLMFPQWVQKDVATNLKPNTFNWKGHYFTGWNTQKDGSGTKYDDKAKIQTNTDVTLYAQWIVDISTMTDKTHWNESDGKYFTISADVTIYGRVVINGDITLILPEGKTLTAKRGITLKNGNALTIEGSGTLVADASEEEGSAGIGGEYEQDGGTITINGGIINATAGEGGAGIGGGSGRDYGRNGGTITINEGTVKATGNEKGAGIGGGSGMHQGGDGGTITINGGTIEATGGRLAAGIGAGHGPFGGNCGTVTINGGTVNASGGDGGAGIGGGITEGECGTVTINGGTVIANGIGGGAGIGGGYSQSGVFVTINGGTVKAASDSNDVPAIGPGTYNNHQGRLTIGYAEIQANSLVINSGWSLYYGNSENPTNRVDGPHDGNDIESYRGRYMNITAP
ncbi:MAG: InlB B-repeat-containing protein [Spirochaetales bacterium]|nr:InlB B-repeat-containing protein [Spirochaetales bacterium]